VDALDPLVVRRVSEQLGRYVYVLIDPKDGCPFYVGKGQGLRMLAHGEEAAAAADLAHLSVVARPPIRRGGLPPVGCGWPEWPPEVHR
jgi:hypothetical protein